MPDANDQAVAAPPPVAAVDDAAPAPSLDETFTAEDRDTSWAPGRERELRDRLAALPPSAVTIAPPECRAQQCRITITAHDDAAIGTFVGMLEEPTGLHGWAEMMVLEAVTTLPSGERRARIYARFARPEDPSSPK
jgi:hypothetical protein